MLPSLHRLERPNLRIFHRLDCLKDSNTTEKGNTPLDLAIDLLSKRRVTPVWKARLLLSDRFHRRWNGADLPVTPLIWSVSVGFASFAK